MGEEATESMLVSTSLDGVVESRGRRGTQPLWGTAELDQGPIIIAMSTCTPKVGDSSTDQRGRVT